MGKPKAEELPTRESLSAAGETQAIPVDLLKLLEAIKSGKFDPEAHIRHMRERNAMLAQRRDEEIETYDSISDIPAVPWLGKDTEFKELLWLQASTWEDYRLFDVPPMPHDGICYDKSEWDKHTVKCPGTMFFYANKTLPVSYSLPTAVSRKRQGKVFFDGQVIMPVLFEQTGPEEDFEQKVWMGLTPMEMITQKAGIDAARGRVVVGGLGLGWFLKEIAAKPEVTEIVVVDVSWPLMTWLRPIIDARFPEVAAKATEWIASDIYHYMNADIGKRGQADQTVYLLDIWPAFGDADYDHAFVLFETMLKERLWGWGRGSTHGGKPPEINPHERLPYPRAYMREKPCTGCPFSRTGVYEKNAVDPLRLVGQSHGPFLLPCHQEPGYQEERQGEVYAKAQCAGAAIFRSNIGLGVKFPKSFHILPADTAAVVATPAELVSKHYGIPLESAEEMLKDTPPDWLLKQELSGRKVRVYGASKKP